MNSLKHTTLAALLCLALAACQQRTPTEQTKHESPPPLSVRLVPVKRGDINRIVALPGNLLPNQQATLYAEVAGYLKAIKVDIGDVVKQGDFLAEIEAPELIADAAKFKADLDVAELDYKRIADAQQKAPDLVVLQNVDAAKAKFLAAKANLERAETLSGFCKITAPFSGTVTRRFVDVGAFIPAATSGSSAQSVALLTLMDFSVVRVQVAVPEPEVPLIKHGMPARISVDELPGRALPVTVTRYSHSLDENKTMLVEFDLQNSDGALLPGMYVTAKIAVEKHSDALVLPVDAMMVEKAGNSVFTVQDGKARKQTVKTGFNDGAQIEILDGVQPNASVILVGKQVLNNGQPVSVTENK